MPYGRDQLVVREDVDNHAQYLLLDPADPTHPSPLAVSAFAINDAGLSADGMRFVYSTWEDGLGTGGNLHVFDLDTRKDRLVTEVDNDRFLWQAPQFMPDGKSVLAKSLGQRWPVYPHDRACRRRRTGPGDRTDPRPGRRRRDRLHRSRRQDGLRDLPRQRRR